MSITIATWFVADTPETSSTFPQVPGASSSPEFQAVYWRSIAGFFATSLIQNPQADHVLFTNCAVPIIDGLNLQDFFFALSVRIVFLEITFRLPSKMAKSWGNQFYILDIIKYTTLHGQTEKILVLDGDCVWNGDIQGLSCAIDRFGCLTYTIGLDDYQAAQPINGVTRREMKDALLSWQPLHDIISCEFGIQYHGGEIFAATLEECKRINSVIDDLWNWQKVDDSPVGFREEAHFLSIIYSFLGYASHTANPYIKRIWTTFKHHNASASDSKLDVWHLPAEKKTGFFELFQLIRLGMLPIDPAELRVELSRVMGVPKRNPSKMLRDATGKIIEHLRR
jgi:hypothetical protein